MIQNSEDESASKELVQYSDQELGSSPPITTASRAMGGDGMGENPQGTCAEGMGCIWLQYDTEIRGRI